MTKRNTKVAVEVRVNLAELRKIRQWLIETALNSEAPPEAVDGLIGLTDEMADYAADVLKDDTALLKDENDEAV